MQRILFVLLCIGIITGRLMSQQIDQPITIEGQVLSDDQPIIGATIQKTKDRSGTISDLDGQWTLKAIIGDQILIQYLGYEPAYLTIDNQTYYTVKLTPSSVQFDEIVVTALGLERTAESLGYSVEKLNSHEINTVKSVNFLDNLNAKIAGVNISQGATGVGSSTIISIRGEASFTNNNPLFVVDGTPINNNTAFNITNEQAAGYQEVDFGNGAMDINSDDIASVSVLKGPGAAALYGTRASNGVIIIETKDGQEAQGLGISFNSSFFAEQALRLPEFQNTYGQGNSGEFEFVDGLGGGINDNITYSYGPKLDVGLNIPQYDSPVVLPDGQIVRGGDVAVHGGADIPATPFISHPDNLKNFYQTGTTAINNLAIGSNFETGSFRLSFADLRSESIIPGVNYNRKNISGRLKFKPHKSVEISSSLNYANASSDNRPASGYGSENINYSLVAWLGRQTDLNPLKNYWQPGLEDLQQYSYNYTFFDNPYFILYENRNAFNRDKLFGNIQSKYHVNDKLSISLRSGIDNSAEDRYFRRAFSSNRFKNGAYAEHNVSYKEMNTDLLVNYLMPAGDLSLDLTVGANRMDQLGSTNQTQTTALAQPGIFRLSNAASPLEIFQFRSQKRINSLFVLAKTSFKDWLYLDISLRNDWSSALATPTSKENTSFFYPSIATSLILSNLVEIPDLISYAKIRANYAEVGNDTNPYQTTGIFVPSTLVNGLPSFTDQSTIPDANLNPERTSSFEIGADIRFFHNRFGFDVTYYNANTTNQILSLPIAVSTGYNQRVLNGGEVNNQGLEVLLKYTPITKKTFSWNITANFSRNITTVNQLPEEVNQLTLAYSRVYDNPNQTVYFIVEEGGRIGDMWGTGYLKNEDGDFMIGEDGRYIVDNTLKKLGNYNPDFILGLTNRFAFGNFSAGLVLDWRQGGELISRTQALAGVAGQLKETEFRPEDGIIAEGKKLDGSDNNVAISAEAYYRQFYDRNHEENNMYDASYLKIREMNIGYNFQNIRGIANARLSLIGRNLWAFSHIPHFDPEQIAIQGNGFVRGVEDMSYASTRSIGLSLNLKF
jgi:TonB-linked SusC/RagA family outer membrane protein